MKVLNKVTRFKHVAINTYIPLGRRVVEAAGVKLVVGIVCDLVVVEFGEDGAQTAPVPVVSHTAPVVTLARHVAYGIERDLLQR